MQFRTLRLHFQGSSEAIDFKGAEPERKERCKRPSHSRPIVPKTESAKNPQKPQDRDTTIAACRYER